jgi:trimethylamine:corrinoid methyltransferase-like protein
MGLLMNSATPPSGAARRDPAESSAAAATTAAANDARAATLWRAALERFEQPPLDDAMHAELSEFVLRRTRELGDEPFPLPGAA